MMILLKENYGQNVAAIAETISCCKDYQSWCDQWRDKFEGFPGIWNLFSRAGAAFDAAEKETRVNWAEVEWVDTIMLYAEKVMCTPDGDLYDMAFNTIKRAMEPEPNVVKVNVIGGKVIQRDVPNPVRVEVYNYDVDPDMMPDPECVLDKDELGRFCERYFIN